ncbi:MAG: hypothetical protein ACTSVZ_08480 [Promethearchaeota archaeon]
MNVSNTSEVYEIIRGDSSIQTLLDRDPDSEIVVNKIEGESLRQLQIDFPELFESADTPEFIFSVNAITSRMFDGKSYLKIKFFISPEGKILKKIMNF